MPGEPTVLVLDVNDKHAPYDTTRDETTTASIFHENFGEKIEKGLMNKLRLWGFWFFREQKVYLSFDVEGQSSR